MTAYLPLKLPLVTPLRVSIHAADKEEVRWSSRARSSAAGYWPPRIAPGNRAIQAVVANGTEYYTFAGSRNTMLHQGCATLAIEIPPPKGV